MLKEINIEQALSILNHNVNKDIMFNIYSTPNGDGSKNNQYIKKYGVTDLKDGILLYESVDYKGSNVIIPTSPDLLSILLITMHSNFDLIFTYKTFYRQIKLVSTYKEYMLK